MPSSDGDIMTDIAAMRKYVQSARRSLPAAALPFATNLIEQFKFYEKVDDEHREGMKPLMAWQWEKLKRAVHSSADRA